VLSLLVGRDREFDSLDQPLDQASSGRGGPRARCGARGTPIGVQRSFLMPVSPTLRETSGLPWTEKVRAGQLPRQRQYETDRKTDLTSDTFTIADEARARLKTVVVRVNPPA
jgi:hypothetical protein